MGIRRRIAAVVGAALLAGMLAPPTASASADLTVGMRIVIGRHSCTLGFFGTNARKDRLAVTAGHCSDQVADQPVLDARGTQIGAVIMWKSDVQDSDGKLNGSRGYTVFQVFRKFSVEPFFTDVSRSLSEGDYVTKYGQRTGKTNGRVTSVKFVRDRPDLGLIKSNIVQLPGDSGCPWYTSGPTIVGMGSSGDEESSGGDAGSQAQPIGSVIDMVRQNPTDWGDEFKVWTDS